MLAKSRHDRERQKAFCKSDRVSDGTEQPALAKYGAVQLVPGLARSTPLVYSSELKPVLNPSPQGQRSGSRFVHLEPIFFFLPCGR